MSDETMAVARQNGSVDDATAVVPPVDVPPALDPTPPHVRRSASNGHAAGSAYPPTAETRPVRRQPATNGRHGNGRRKAPPDEPRRSGGGWGGRILILLAVLALLSVIAMAQFLVKGAINKDQGDDSPKKAPKTAAPAAPAGQKVPIVAAVDFDPAPDGNGEEHPEDVANTYDGDPDSAWQTMSYKRRPELGGTKDGVGIVYDLGAPVDVARVTVSLVGEPTSLELRIPKDDTTRSPESADGWKPVAQLEDVKEGNAVLKPATPTKTRYVLVWLTSLPKESDGNGYRGEISEVSVQR
jgi:hypothetical protein